MKGNYEPVYSGHAVEFVAVANEFCKYSEHASEMRGDEILNILQRLLPLLYLKASFLPKLEPVFDDGNEKFVTEADWFRIHDGYKSRFGTANDYLELPDDISTGDESPLVFTLAEDMADIYQDIKNFLLLYQTGTTEVMNDAVWECKLNFENYWGNRLISALKAIHRFVCSEQKIEEVKVRDDEKDMSGRSNWFISKRQKEFREEDE